MKYFYSVYTGGAVVISAPKEFPLADLTKTLSETDGTPVFIVFWREISKSQFDAFSAYLKGVGVLDPNTCGEVKEAGVVDSDDTDSSHH